MKMKTILSLVTLLCISTLVFSQGSFDVKKVTPVEDSNSVQSMEVKPEALELWKRYQERIELNKIERPALDINRIKKPSLKLIDKAPASAMFDEAELPYFIKVDQSSIAETQDLRKLDEIIEDFLVNYSSIIGIDNAEEAFKERTRFTDTKGLIHVRLDQYWNDIAVYGSDAVIHINEKGVYAFNGRYSKQPTNISAVPSLNTETAIMKAVDHLVEKEGIELMSLSEISEKLIRDPEPVAELMVYQVDGNAHLVYHIEYSPLVHKHYHYLIDAHSGEVLKKYNDVCYLGPETATATDLGGQTRTINTWEEGGTYYLLDGARTMFSLSASNMPDDPIGALLTLDANNADPESSNFVSNITHNSSSNNNWNDPTAVSAHYNVGEAYEYFLNTFNRNSIDGAGGSVYSVINISSGGQDVDNAFWNGAIFYGNGAQLMTDIPRALDIAGHEMAHGVTQNTAGLVYEFQSGALNESFSDVFGAMIDRDDWTMGEDVVNSSLVPTGVLRDMQNPNNGGSSSNFYWQPNHMNQYANVPFSTDNGGVHINSGIPNKAYYLFATAVGKETAEQVYYCALTNYLTQNSQFVDCRASVVQCASDLFSSSVANAAAQAFTDVGIIGDGMVGTGGGGANTNDLPQLQGVEHLLGHIQTTGASSGDVYDYNVQDDVVTQATAVAALAKVSIVDNGELGFFVGSDNQIYTVDLTVADPTTTVSQFSTNPEWRKVAISRDGTKLAALTTNNDNTVIIVTSSDQTTFTLTNPSTSSDGTSAGGPEYADAIEFSPYGDYLMYDALNEISGTGGTTVTFWDIGLLKVWDNGSNDFGDGSIQKIFPPQASNISIGNATFSKNSPYIVALDYLDSSSGDEFVVAANIISGEAEGVAQTNGIIGYPSYSPADDAIAYSDQASDGTYTIDFIAVGSDKITPSGSAQTILNSASWPVWYMQGNRNWSAPVANFSVNTDEGGPGLTVNFSDESTNSPMVWSWTFEQGTPSTSSEFSPIVTYPNEGEFNVTLTVSNPAGTDTETKTNYIKVGVGLNVEEIKVEEALIYNQPNPFKGSTELIINLPESTEAHIALFDLSGKEIKSIHQGFVSSGQNAFQIETEGLAAGIYLIELTSAEFALSTKAIIQE